MSERKKPHVKARLEKHALYPTRFSVPDDKVSFDVPFPEYDPPYFVTTGVLEKGAPENIKLITGRFKSFEGEINLDSLGRPLNPMGRTGIAGRGTLWQWGTNVAVDAIFTRVNTEEDKILVLLIKRKDTGTWAFPGGMIDKEESELHAVERELFEETGVRRSMADSDVVYCGYVDGPRNTDHAWIETIVRHVHLPRDPGWIFQPADDAVKVEWFLVNPELFQTLYGSHGEILKIVVSRLYETSAICQKVKAAIEKLGAL